MSADPEPDDLLTIHLAESAVTKANADGKYAIAFVNQFEVEPRMMGIPPK